MKKLFKKLFKNLFLVAAVISLLSSTAVNAIPLNSINQAFATTEACGNKSTYERTDSQGDLNNTKVFIDFTDFQNHQGSSNDGYYRITVSAKSGYQISKVWLDVANDGQSGYSQSFNGPLNNYNPVGNQINKAKVEVIKICTPVCTDSSANNYDSHVSSSEIADNSVCTYTDVCTNIPDNQLTLPANHYFASAGICIPQTPVCTDTNASNYDSNVDANEYANNNVCQYPIDLCLNLPDTQTSVPEGYEMDGEGNCVEKEDEEEKEEEPQDPVCDENEVLENGICIECDGEGECEIIIGDGEGEENETTPTPTPTKTQTNTGGPGDGLSDGRSDGRSDGMSSSVVQTDSGTIESYTMAPTGSFQNILSNGLFGLGLVFSTLAGASHVKKKKN